MSPRCSWVSLSVAQNLIPITAGDSTLCLRRELSAGDQLMAQADLRHSFAPEVQSTRSARSVSEVE